LPQLAHVDSQDAALRDVVGNHLIERARVQIRALFGLHKLLADVCGRHDPPDSQAGTEGFGERAQVDRPLWGQSCDGCQVFSLVSQCAIGIILDDQEIVVACNLHKAPTTGFGESRARRIVEVGQDVDEPHRDAADDFLKHLDLHSVVVQGHGHKVGLVRTPRLDGTQVRWPAGEHRCAGVDEHLPNQVQGLLGSGGDQDVVWSMVNSVIRHGFGQELAQRRMSLGCAVLQGRLCLVPEKIAARLLDLAYGKKLGGWKPSGK